ncbi:MAG TPA: L,D-transpeptidase family protein [Planctomycetota bacterium]|nr:L,D-transpeptidase family protein [Planctomycetota bacterium]HRR80758.1 L,D-transpeptidase family protein [Planctomycetota bacterium]HRT94397.1 L,D-transpeptidase family protein [Planctomycetota bacterium]
MKRSWIALGAVIAVIVVAIVVLSRQPKPAVVAPVPEPSPKVGTETPSEPAKEPAKEPEPKSPPEPKEKAKEPEPPKKAEPVDSDAVLRAADAALAAGKPVEAHKVLSDAILRDPKAAKAADMRTRLTKLSEEIFFSDKVFAPYSIAYTVVAGDALVKIAGKHKTTIELLRRINGLKGDNLRIGQRLKVIPGGFDVAVDKSDFRLTVTKDGAWVREFLVGLGKNGTTPVGEFVAGHKLKEPVYFGDGTPIPYGDKTKNPLGTRWITIQAEYGIHGTWEPDSMGKEGSKGCVRMVNQDVEWLFDLMVPGSSRIVIRP